jgi:hypothetical protein
MNSRSDLVRDGFLVRQYAAAAALAAESDVLQFAPLSPPPSQQFIAEFRCTGALRGANGQVVVRKALFAVHVFFPDDYLRRVEPGNVVQWLAPLEVAHPNIRPPHVCLGHLVPGTELVDLLYQVYEMITYTKFTPREDDALNPEACKWARANLQRFPLDRAPLRRRAPSPQAVM